MTGTSIVRFLEFYNLGHQLTKNRRFTISHTMHMLGSSLSLVNHAPFVQRILTEKNQQHTHGLMEYEPFCTLSNALKSCMVNIEIFHTC
jgi:hypothetical protein